MPFPNYQDKYLKKALFNPKDFESIKQNLGKKGSTNIPSKIIFCYYKALMDHIRDHETLEPVTGFADNFHGDFFLLPEYSNDLGIIGSFGIGAPISVIIAETLIALGTKTILTVGSAGSLKQTLNIGDIILCTHALRDEGTSYHYLSADSEYSYASEKFLDHIRKTLIKIGVFFTEGPSWTIDAPYRETIEEIEHYRKEGIITVEMEASALFALGEYRKIDIGALFVISDILSSTDWKPAFHKLPEFLPILFKLAVKSLIDYK
ncbi:MAG: nucleoside phosphorylase [Candidatus Hodarchaeales archaeon]|jgi:purine-nucleoside phosphorylase